MNRLPVFRSLAITAIFWIAPPTLQADDPPRNLQRVAEFQIVHPETLAARINRLFDGAKVPHAAAALGAWKRATGGKGQLGKPLEALIALFNPEMAHEWRSFNEATLTIWSGEMPAKSATLDWSIVIPRDDGSIAAFVTAARLTGGGKAQLPGRPELAIDRLGPAGAPLAIRLGDRLVIAASPRSLSQALDNLERPAKTVKVSDNRQVRVCDSDPHTPGIHFEIDGRICDASPPGTFACRAIAELGRAIEGRAIAGFATLDGDAARIRIRSSGGKVGPSTFLHGTSIDPGWLRWIPAEHAMAAVTARFDPSPSTWTTLFNVIDRIEKSDPTKVGTMPIRTRLNLLLAAARVQPEIDLWPHLEGTTVCLLTDRAKIGAPSGMSVALHLDGEPAARKLCEVLVPRIAETFLRRNGGIAEKAADPSGDRAQVSSLRKLGDAENRPVLVARRGRTVLLGWGEEKTFAHCLDTPDAIGIPPALTMLPDPGERASSRLALVWPGRFGFRPGGLDPSSDAWRVIADAAPIIWAGGQNPEKTQIDDLIIWRGLHSLVRQFLDAIPLDLDVSDGRSSRPPARP